MPMKRLKVTRGGQISLPAEVRHRWGTSSVAMEDLGDRIVVSPLPDDPVAAARGALTGEARSTSEQLRRAARADEDRAEQRRRRR